MNVIVIDYSEMYYSTVAKKTVPERRSGKFVQIRHYRTEYLLFSPKEFMPYHADLVEFFSAQEGLKGARNGGGKRFDIGDPRWVVVGGGKFEIDGASKLVRLYDESAAYGKFDVGGLEEKILSASMLAGYRVTIE